MPNAKDNAKLSGDTHLPDLDGGDATPDDRVPGERGNAAGGEIKDKEAETSNSYGHTRDSGERPQVKPKDE
jgi:hypothetical protein